MNERFKELAVQSELWRMLEEYSWEFGSCDPEKDCGRIEKFAELIVRECSQYIEDKFDFCGDELIIAEKLLEHFGVK